MGGDGGMGGNGGIGGGPPPECMEAADCTQQGTANVCGAPACEAGKCVRKALLPAGTAVPSQVYGDCLEVQCNDSAEPAPVFKNDDVYNDGNQCTDDVCMDGVLMHNLQMQGYLCGGDICNDMGQCVECIEGVQGCNDVSQTCMQGVCVSVNCNNGIKNPGEGDIDCGGNCLPCDDAKTCTNGSQCKSGVCTGGTCAVPTCMDGVKNGSETGFDCGGGLDCLPCPKDEGCKLPTDCESGVCVDVFCAEPSCTDALQNGDEAGIDCGGPLCAPCP